MPKTVIKFLVIILIGYAVGMTFYQKKTLSHVSLLESRLRDLNEMNSKAKSELDRINSDKEAVEKQAAKLKEGALSYLKQQEIMHNEIGALKKENASYKNNIDSLTRELTQEKNAANKLKQEQKQLGLKKDSEVKAKEGQINRLNDELAKLKREFDKKEALFHYNSGVLFTENSRYDEAVNEYEKALDINPEFSNIYYNLGIIYNDYFKDAPKAAYYFKRYLELEPNAIDAEEVQSWLFELQ